ncbi:CorA family divalent cation transporter [Roseibium aquae]|nr:CorA family divalent cation transporter [Roseibium aquae]
MIVAYCPSASGLERVELSAGTPLPATSVWIDLHSPTEDEQAAAEKLMGAAIPKRDEMRSIESSARLYDEPGALVMTAPMPVSSVERGTDQGLVTFVLSSKRLVTVRHGNIKSLDLLSRLVQSDQTVQHMGPAVFFSLMEIMVDGTAEAMERASADHDKLALHVFEDGVSSRRTPVYQEAIRGQGRLSLTVAALHDVCASLARLLLFLDAHAAKVALSDPQKASLQLFGRDIHSIKEHGDALDAKLNYLLDATVGLISLEQNQIGKIFSFLGVIFLPPTLIASVYGMNFENIPELQWRMGFWFSIMMMVTSVLLTFLFFRWRKLL